MVSTQSSSSAETFASGLAAEIFGTQPLNAEKDDAPTVLNPLSDYYSLLTSYLTVPNQQQQQQQQQHLQTAKTGGIPMDYCVMPMKMQLAQPQTAPLDDFPDDLSGIFDD